MNGHGNVVAKGMVVEHIDAKEQDDIDEPAADRDLVRRNKKRRARAVELRNVASDGNEEELDECEKGSCEFSCISACHRHEAILQTASR